MIDFPAREVRPAHVPLFPRPIRGEDERALFRGDQDSDSALVRKDAVLKKLGRLALDYQFVERSGF
jgi:hypothetical protein